MNIMKRSSSLMSSLFNWPDYSVEDLKSKGTVTEEEKEENGYKTKVVKCQGDGFYYAKSITEFLPRKEDKLKQIEKRRKWFQEEMNKLDELENEIKEGP